MGVCIVYNVKKRIISCLILATFGNLHASTEFKALEASELTEKNKFRIINSIPNDVKDKMLSMVYEQIKKEAEISPFKVAKIEIHYGNSRPMLEKLEKIGKGASYFLFEDIKQDLTKNGYKFGECIASQIFSCTVLW